jgi:predicted nucleic acid-binding protein
VDRFEKRLSKARSLGLDTSLFIYFFESNLRYAPLAEITLKGIESGKWKGSTSAITIMELTVHPWRLGQEQVAREYESVLANFPNLMIVDIDRHVARQAAQLRASYNISPADALQIGACLIDGAEVFITNDRRLERLDKAIDIVILEDYVKQVS